MAGPSSAAGVPKMAAGDLVSLPLNKYRKVAVDFCSDRGPMKEHFVETRHALSLLLKSNEDMGKKIKTWSITDLVVMTLAAVPLRTPHASALRAGERGLQEKRQERVSMPPWRYPVSTREFYQNSIYERPRGPPLQMAPKKRFLIPPCPIPFLGGYDPESLASRNDIVVKAPASGRGVRGFFERDCIIVETHSLSRSA